MKRYILAVGSDYCPEKNFEDIVFYGDSLQECLAYLKTINDNGPNHTSMSWMAVLDVEEQRVVAQGNIANIKMIDRENKDMATSYYFDVNGDKIFLSYQAKYKLTDKEIEREMARPVLPDLAKE